MLFITLRFNRMGSQLLHFMAFICHLMRFKYLRGTERTRFRIFIASYSVKTNILCPNKETLACPQTHLKLKTWTKDCASFVQSFTIRVSSSVVKIRILQAWHDRSDKTYPCSRQIIFFLVTSFPFYNIITE